MTENSMNKTNIGSPQPLSPSGLSPQGKEKGKEFFRGFRGLHYPQNCNVFLLPQ
jgi:hypothetical protein